MVGNEEAVTNGKERESMDKRARGSEIKREKCVARREWEE